MAWFIGVWLPHYSGSILFFTMLLPICVFDSKMDISCTTYLKVMRREGVLLGVNAITVALGTIFTVVSVYVFNSVEMAIGGAVLLIAVRSLSTEIWLNKQLGVRFDCKGIEIIVMTGVFLVSTEFLTQSVAFFICVLSYSFYLFHHGGRVVELCRKVRQARAGESLEAP